MFMKKNNVVERILPMSMSMRIVLYFCFKIAERNTESLINFNWYPFMFLRPKSDDCVKAAKITSWASIAQTDKVRPLLINSLLQFSHFDSLSILRLLLKSRGHPGNRSTAFDFILGVNFPDNFHNKAHVETHRGVTLTKIALSLFSITRLVKNKIELVEAVHLPTILYVYMYKPLNCTLMQWWLTCTLSMGISSLGRRKWKILRCRNC